MFSVIGLSGSTWIMSVYSPFTVDVFCPGSVSDLSFPSR
jgi:hypothetical protein